MLSIFMTSYKNLNPQRKICFCKKNWLWGKNLEKNGGKVKKWPRLGFLRYYTRVQYRYRYQHLPKQCCGVNHFWGRFWLHPNISVPTPGHNRRKKVPGTMLRIRMTYPDPTLQFFWIRIRFRILVFKNLQYGTQDGNKKKDHEKEDYKKKDHSRIRNCSYGSGSCKIIRIRILQNHTDPSGSGSATLSRYCKKWKFGHPL